MNPGRSIGDVNPIRFATRVHVMAAGRGIDVPRFGILIGQQTPVGRSGKPQIEMGKTTKLPGWEEKPVPYLQYSRGSFLGSVVEQLFSSNPPNLAVKHVNAFSEALKNLCVHGAGIAWLPEASIKRELAEGKLVIAGDENWWIDLKVVIYTEAQLHQNQSTRVWQHLQSAASTREAT